MSAGRRASMVLVLMDPRSRKAWTVALAVLLGLSLVLTAVAQFLRV